MQNHNANAVLDVGQFLGSYLKQEDLNGDTVATIVDAYGEMLEGEDKAKLVIKFAEFPKPLILNSTNIRELAAIFRDRDANTWRGPIMLYVDPNVTFGGKVTGGIRVRPAASNGAARSERVRPKYDDELDGVF